MHRLVSPVGFAAPLIVACSAPAGAGPLDGYYYDRDLSGDSSAVAQACAHHEEPKSQIIVDDRYFYGGELATSCRLTNPVQVRDMNATLYDGQCWSEAGEGHLRIFVLRRDYPEGAIDIRGDHPWLNQELNRCP